MTREVEILTSLKDRFEDVMEEGLLGVDTDAVDALDSNKEIVDALEVAIQALEQEPCADCISRQAVIDSFKNKFSNGFDSDRWWNSMTVLHVINKVPPVTPKSKTEWIPVEWKPFGKNGYPKPEDEYKNFLTIDNKGEITIQEFLLSLDEEPQPYFTGMRNIIAWMPLPEPYQTESEVEK